MSRIKECLVKYFVSTTLKGMNASEIEEVLNPNEVGAPFGLMPFDHFKISILTYSFCVLG